MRSLSSIQDQVRVYSNDSVLVITDNSTDKNKGLNIANEVYLRLSTVYNWPEFVRIDETINTESGTPSYNYPSSPSFSNILNIEMLNEKNKYEIIPRVKDELDWSFFSSKTQSFPSVYRLNSSGSQKQIEFAPSPNISKKIRIRGVVEPAKFVNGDSETIFSSEIADNVLEFLIAAAFLFKRRNFDLAQVRLRQGSSLLKNYTGKEIPEQELDPRAKQVENVQP